MSSRASNIRKLTLGLLIFTDILMLICWWLAGQYVFFWVFIGINLCVITGEVVNVVLMKKTLSTQTTNTLEENLSKNRQKRLCIYLALTFLALTIGLLIAHLIVI